jgi:acyl dehydratase
MPHQTLQNNPNARYLEDIEVGQTFVSDTHAVDEQQITAFAKQFDPQPFHTDAQLAKQTLFGGLIASGWHSAAMTMRLLVEAFPIANGVIGLGGEAAWPNATRAGDVIHVEGKVTDIKPSRSHPDRGVVTIQAETKNQKNEVVQTLTAKLLVFSRTAEKPATD